jgi:hypothetical protein
MEKKYGQKELKGMAKYIPCFWHVKTNLRKISFILNINWATILKVFCKLQHQNVYEDVIIMHSLPKICPIKVV